MRNVVLGLTNCMTQSPFELLGQPARMDLDEDQLEASYLESARDCHPDFNLGVGEEERLRTLTRSAEVNTAYRRLRDPWLRAEAIIELADTEAMETTKTLSPVFLMEALETRESVELSPPGDLPELERVIEIRVREFIAEISERIEASEPREAATLLHQSTYYRKALADLRERIQTVT